eukprot:CAMPEP_0196579848 /NCGR_PEP_ID=MMETSP1081-20130531/25193_1 /TAXON_ID=36882 /ORGANISM="Pyramimonas amylifera, Strain CCMP720" /LENGTH=159 /DNA_ID=CAMNT_0041899551 /DNA_START=319 /DNA_END=795 /DNA_ORIENTATION=+
MLEKGSAEAGGFGIQRGRLRQCPADNNCVSTSSTNPEQYAAAWIALGINSSQDAAVELTAAVRQVIPGASLKETTKLDNGEYYLRYITPGPYGTDIFEFLIRSEGLGDRNWEGDLESDGLLVTYRSIGNTKYVYPFLTPVSDFKAQSKRMQLVRETLGW